MAVVDAAPGATTCWPWQGQGEDPLLYYMSAKVDPAPEEEKKYGTHWPAIDTWSFGIWLEGATLLFLVAEEFKL